jgi:DNA repair exonuclease SbcCD ATPase subunit
MAGFAFIVALVAAVLAVVFFLQGQSAARAIKALREDADAARREAETARGELRRAQEESKTRAALLSETREKLAETRRKAQEGRSGKAAPKGAREAELEEDLAHARRLTEEAHAAETHARRDLLTARSAEAQFRSELEKAQARIRDMAERPPVAPAPAVPPPQPPLDPLREQLEAAKSELDRQVAAAERHAREAKRREQELREEMRKHKGRAETNNRVYLITKGELEILKERLAQAERKLWQAGIPLAPPQQKDRPKAKGPAAADRTEEESAGQTTSDAAPLEGASPEAAEAGEPIGAAQVEESRGSAEETIAAAEAAAVPPIRRRAENGAEKKPL